MQAANIIHAAGESSPGNLSSGTHAVALHAAPERLARLLAQLQAARVPHTPIFEPDAPFDGALMAIGIRPCRREEVRRLLSSLPLVR